MAQKEIKYKFLIKRLVEQASANCFVFYQNMIKRVSIPITIGTNTTDYPQNKKYKKGSKLRSFFPILGSFFYRQRQSDALSCKLERVSLFSQEHRSETVCRNTVLGKIYLEERSFDTTKYIYFCLIFIFSLGACGEPEIKLDRAARRTIDTLVNYQLDSISPILDSLCKATSPDFIQHAVDSIVKERQKKEERLRLNIPAN